jgi:RluA family pseudouridine synthase
LYLSPTKNGYNERVEISVLHADEVLLVVSKPAGLLSLPDGYDPALPHLRSLLEPAWGRLWIVHRLDRDTSGVLALARSAEAHRALSLQFQKRRTEKIYHALVWGLPAWDEITLEMPLRPNTGRRKRTAVDETRGLPARTEVRVLRRMEVRALVEARPRTGRRHQIRAHLYAAGHPVVGDPLYGRGSPLQIPGLSRLGLHAYSLGLQHPRTGRFVTFQAPYPPDFEQALSR